jgi:gluconokinase
MTWVAARPPAEHRLAVVVMGVSGCGKSTLAAGIAGALGLPAIDGDDLHAPESVARMKNGFPLTDTDRWPWLERIGARLADARQAPAGVVLSCSALKRAYREHIRTACPGVRFLFLDGNPDLIRARMVARQGHYMPAGLLDSQLRTLERPGAEEADVHRVEIDAPVARQVALALAALRP